MKKIVGLLAVVAFGVFTTQSQNPLFIPPLDSGVWIGGARTFNLNMQNDSTQFLPGLWTQTAGYNGNFLGPTLYTEKGDSLVLNISNNLGENSTTHWHGLHVPAEMDGGPHQMIADGSSWTSTFEMRNEASTFWYHPHHKPDFWMDSDGTGGQVFRGLAGMMIVEDNNSMSLALPNTYGVDEIPLIIQDRAFWPDGSFKDIMELNPALAGRPGDTVLVNGTLNSEHQTHAQLIRFRILNASNTRTYYLGFDDNRNFEIIGTDGGFLNSPVSLNRIRISPAERVEIVVDFSADNGSIITLMSYGAELYPIMPVFVEGLVDDLDTTNYNIMTFNVGPPTTVPSPIFVLPTTLNNIVPYDTLLADVSRPFVLSNGPPMSINGATMDMAVINEVIQLGDLELWTITNTSGSSHPFHVHGQPFQVVSRSDGPVEAWEQGWKDVVFVTKKNNSGNPGWVKIIKPFEDFVDSINPFMYHCHILEHEDRGMMGQYTVVDTATTVSISDGLPNDEFSVRIFPNPLAESLLKVEISIQVTGEYSFTLINAYGQSVKTLLPSQSLSEGDQKFMFDLSDTPSGFYLVKIDGLMWSRSYKFFKI